MKMKNTQSVEWYVFSVIGRGRQLCAAEYIGLSSAKCLEDEVSEAFPLLDTGRVDA